MLKSAVSDENVGTDDEIGAAEEFMDRTRYEETRCAGDLGRFTAVSGLSTMGGKR